MLEVCTFIRILIYFRTLCMQVGKSLASVRIAQTRLSLLLLENGTSTNVSLASQNVSGENGRRRDITWASSRQNLSFGVSD